MNHDSQSVCLSLQMAHLRQESIDLPEYHIVQIPSLIQMIQRRCVQPRPLTVWHHLCMYYNVERSSVIYYMSTMRLQVHYKASTDLLNYYYTWFGLFSAAVGL